MKALLAFMKALLAIMIWLLATLTIPCVVIGIDAVATGDTLTALLLFGLPAVVIAVIWLLVELIVRAKIRAQRLTLWAWTRPGE